MLVCICKVSKMVVFICTVGKNKYLGFTISNADNNMANIRSVRNKSFGTIKAIFNKLKDIKLRKYYFECGMIFLKVMLRSSILYGSETYYNLKEGEIRALERIEEIFSCNSACAFVSFQYTSQTE